MNNLKPGDRALLIWARPRYARFIGGVYVLGEKVLVDGPSFVIAVEGHVHYAAPERHLIRIPPDSEMRQMFRETGRPKEAA